MVTRMDAVSTARAVVAQEAPHCLAAFLAGSVVRGDATAGSDLDILVIVPVGAASYRQSFRAFGWPVELFVQTTANHRQFVAQDAARRRPSTSMLCCEGVILRDEEGLASRLKAEACHLLAAGPPPLAQAELDWARYCLTDLLDDFVYSESEEALFIANDLAVGAANLMLDYHGLWRGNGKWVLRALRALDSNLAERLAEALARFYRGGDKQPLIAFVDAALAPVGGRLWEGFRIDNRPASDEDPRVSAG